ncbi:hypothetical protein [Devosia ureilytica]
MDVHYLNRDPRLAEEALRKLELQAARPDGDSIKSIDGGFLKTT